MLSSEWELPDMDPFLSTSKLDFTGFFFMCRVIRYSFQAACNHRLLSEGYTYANISVCVVQY